MSILQLPQNSTKHHQKATFGMPLLHTYEPTDDVIHIVNCSPSGLFKAVFTVSETLWVVSMGPMKFAIFEFFQCLHVHNFASRTSVSVPLYISIK